MFFKNAVQRSFPQDIYSSVLKQIVSNGRMKIKLPEHFFFLDVIKNLTLRRPASDNVGNAKFRSFPMVLRMRRDIVTDLEHGLTAFSLAEMLTVGTLFALTAHDQHFWPLASSSSHPLFLFYSLVCL